LSDVLIDSKHLRIYRDGARKDSWLFRANNIERLQKEIFSKLHELSDQVSDKKTLNKNYEEIRTRKELVDWANSCSKGLKAKDESEFKKNMAKSDSLAMDKVANELDDRNVTYREIDELKKINLFDSSLDRALHSYLENYDHLDEFKCAACGTELDEKSRCPACWGDVFGICQFCGAILDSDDGECPECVGAELCDSCEEEYLDFYGRCPKCDEEISK
jgi:hypothetical protein